MASMNVFRILADVSHTASKCILIWSIHSNRSAEGVSLLTQVMYTFVFAARYLDLFWVSPLASWWNFILKIFYISSSIYIIVLMMRVFARTREREKAWKLAAYCCGGALLATPLINLIFQDRARNRMRAVELSWTFSIILESVCVLPQLLLLRQTSVPTVIDSFYLVTLGSYRGFYILNWIYRGIRHVKAPNQWSTPDPVSVIFGIVQTAFYLDFAWVYWSRQRVKLRGGGVVDSEDLRKGWLVNRFIPVQTEVEDDVEAEGDNAIEEAQARPAARPKSANRWGNRGISISADDTLANRDRVKQPGKQHPAGSNSYVDQHDGFLTDDDDDDDDDAAGQQPSQGASAPKQSGGVLNSDSEWQK